MKKLILKKGRLQAVRFMALFGIAAGILFGTTGLFAQSTNPAPYCSVNHDNMGGNGCQSNYGFNILSVELNGVTQNFSCNSSTIYRYYNSSNLTTLKRGLTYTLKVRTASTVYTTASAGWLDFGSDLSFATSGDFLGSQIGNTAPTLSYTFTVPASATPGKTRLRVRCDYYSVMASTAYCGNPTNYYGETLDFDVEIEQANYPDLSVASLDKPFNVCGDNSDSIAVMLNNYGNAALSNFPITCEMTGTMNGSPVNQTFNATITNTIAILESYRFVFPTSINTNTNGSLNFKIYSAVATDGDKTNDTLKITKIFYGTPNNPAVSNVDRCGVGTVPLTATPASGLDNIRWYSAASGGSSLGAGSTITSPFYTASTTVYAQASRNGATGSFAPSTTGNTVYWGGTTNEQGGMMNVIPSKTMIVNNIFIRKFYGFTANYKVFIRVGGFQGYETNPSAWTLAGSASNVTGGSGTMIPINIGGFILEAGVTYGIYVQCLGDDFWIRYNGAPPFYESNADMLLVNGSYLYGNFSNVVPWYCIDVRFDYTTMCMGNRVPVNVTIKPAPKATTLLKGATFNGAFNSGTAQDPDITASGDVVEYSLVTPQGYNSSQHGINWSVSSITVQSASGVNLPPANMTFTAPSVSGDGKLSINPPAGYTDSSMTITVTVNAQGCDTIFYRSIFFAPRPVASFTSSVACDGNAVQFDNNTVLTTGTISYLWNFGDGKTSTLINPAHTYPTHGTYNVTLTATSNYGYVSVSNLSVTVNQNPEAEFGHTNVCEGAATPFVDGSVIPAGTPTFAWDFGDGSAMGTGSAPSHQYANTDVYLVTMTVTANGCSDQAQHYVTYAARAVPNFTIQGGGCNSEIVSLTNGSTLSSGQMGYTWDLGDNTTSTQPNPSHEYTAFGTISITLTVTTDLGCSNQVTKQISLIEAPHASFTTSLLCNNTNVDFTNTTLEPATANTTYTWSFSDGSTFNTNDVSKTFPGVGTYTATLTAFADNGCSDVQTAQVVLEETPLVEFYATDVCEGTATNFQNATVGNNNNLNYAWDFGTSGTSNSKNPSMVLPVGQTSVTLTATTPSSGCEASVTKMVTVNKMPVLSNVVVNTALQGNGTMSVSFDATPAGTAYSVFWGDGGRKFGTASGSTNNEIYTYPVDGKYTVEVRLDNKGCMSTGTTKADVFRTSVVNFSEGSLNVYPNPTSGIVNLNLEGLNTSGMQIDVYAANGQKIDGHVLIDGALVQLDLSAAVSGVYLVRVSTESGVHTARITVN